VDSSKFGSPSLGGRMPTRSVTMALTKCVGTLQAQGELR
jgi:hypothetical protein